MTPTVTASSRVRLRPLVIRVEDDGYVVGSVDNGEFVELPAVGKRAVEMLAGNRTLAEVQDSLEGEYGVSIDLTDFVGQLAELGFVAEVDGQRVADDAPDRGALPWLRPQHLAWLLSRPVALVYFAVLLAAAVLLVVQPAVRPYGDNIIVVPWTSIAVIVVMVGFMIVVALHELGHLVAARALGLPARISLTTRLYFITARTEVPSLWAVPRRRRYLVYLAGIGTDLLLFSLSVLVSSMWPSGRDWLGLVTVLTMFDVILQLQLYMKTDLYLVAADLTRSKNLFQDSSTYVRYRLGLVRDRLARRPRRTRPRALDDLPAREYRTVRRYAAVMAVGTTLSVAFYVLALLPAMINLGIRSVESINEGFVDGHVEHIVDGGLTLTAQVSLYALFLRTWWRRRRTR